MKKLFFIIRILFVLVSCSFQNKNEKTKQYSMLKLIEEEREEIEEIEEIIKELKDLKKEIEAYLEKDTFYSELKKDIKDEKYLEYLINLDREIIDEKYLKSLTFEFEPEFLHKEL